MVILTAMKEVLSILVIFQAGFIDGAVGSAGFKGAQEFVFRSIFFFFSPENLVCRICNFPKLLHNNVQMEDISRFPFTPWKNIFKCKILELSFSLLFDGRNFIYTHMIWKIGIWAPKYKSCREYRFVVILIIGVVDKV